MVTEVGDGVWTPLNDIRSLRFTAMGLRRNMATPEEEVSTSMTLAYGRALKPYHGWAVRPLFLVSRLGFTLLRRSSIVGHESRPISLKFLPRLGRTCR
jgi:hypothetical protein